MVFFDKALYVANFHAIQPTTTLQPDGIKLEFCNFALSLNVHMRWFISVTGIENDTDQFAVLLALVGIFIPLFV